MVNVSDKKCAWFVSAFHNQQDQTQFFLEKGIWELATKDHKQAHYLEEMRPGDLIAIKTTYTRKKNLPFDNKGQTVSVMAIKATGTIVKNFGDGKTIKVDWKAIEPPKEWYFYTYRSTIWRVTPGKSFDRELIDFTFNDVPQRYSVYKNDSFWRERFGTQFAWTGFYETFADRLLSYADDRQLLVQAIHSLQDSNSNLQWLEDQYADGRRAPLDDICPFTVMAIFNRGLSVENRRRLATDLKNILGINAETPESFRGVPTVNNQNSWFFAYSKQRANDDIDKLWRVFTIAYKMANNDNAGQYEEEFIKCYDAALEVKFTKWNLTLGLFWLSPWNFVPLDTNTRNYIKDELKIDVSFSEHRPFSGSEYLSLLDKLTELFNSNDYPIRSFPQLSYQAWLKTKKDSDVKESVPKAQFSVGAIAVSESTQEEIKNYDLEQIVSDGSFFHLEELSYFKEVLEAKKNIILQGPPGTGKTWLARRLAYTLNGTKDDETIHAIQFHPSLSYEDFIRGWRPSGSGVLSLEDGVFMQAVNQAHERPSSNIVVLIEEINRGNPAQIFGEMLTLLESSKRNEQNALRLTYPDKNNNHDPVFIPKNLYLIGTMNVADRSIALVDIALRRRFAFLTLEPKFNQAWEDWLERHGVNKEHIKEIKNRIRRLNETIGTDNHLGRQFKIGHSYVTPNDGEKIDNVRNWFNQIVETEIGPLLEEYWFDDLRKASDVRKQLLDNW